MKRGIYEYNDNQDVNSDYTDDFAGNSNKKRQSMDCFSDGIIMGHLSEYITI